MVQQKRSKPKYKNILHLYLFGHVDNEGSLASMTLLAGALSLCSTYADGNQPAFPLHSPSDHPF